MLKASLVKNRIVDFLKSSRPNIILLIIIAVFIFDRFGLISKISFPWPSLFGGDEIVRIKETDILGERVKLYRQLIERVGPEQAQEDLFNSGLPFVGETHLLNHVSGDYLYEKYGAAGLSKCKDYFLSSCHHGFVLHAIGTGGMPEVVNTLNECKRNSMQTLAQCTHAVGHGLLAHLGYKNIIEALKLCDDIKEKIPELYLFSCYDGLFMENIWGVHDGQPSPDRWIKPEDKMYPCNDPRIDEKYLLGCWSNQPALAYQLSDGDISKVPAVCMKIKNSEQKEMCFDGLARQIHPLANGSIDKTFELCSLMPDSKWKNFCLVVNAASYFGMGDRVVPFGICARVDNGTKPECYGRVFSNMNVYVKKNDEFYSLCKNIEDAEWEKKCRELPFKNN